MRVKQYKSRIYDQILCSELQGAGAVVIEGAKWCGKTTNAEQTAKSAIYIDERRGSWRRTRYFF